MKKTLLFTLILASIVWAKQAGAQETIDNYVATIKINSDSTLEILETIIYNFDSEEKHGIFRLIPYKYKARGGNYSLRLDILSITDSQGNDYTYQTVKDDGFINIRIGDDSEYVSGVKTYKINYRVGRAINYFKDHDELYWNVTGHDWPVDIKQALTEVILPESVDENQVQKECFAGKFGSSDQCISTRYEYSGQGMVNKIVFTNDKIPAGEGLTIVIGLPAGTLTKPSFLESIVDTLRDNWIAGLPLAVLLIMFYLWRHQGRDPAGRGTIIAQYEPPDNLTPAEVGTIIDATADHLDISAEIVYLAIKGYLKIERLEKAGILKQPDYELVKLKDGSDMINLHEQKLFNSLFANGRDRVKLAELKNEFYKDLAKIQKDLYETMVAKDYFTKNPNKVRNKFFILGTVFIFLGFLVSAVLGLIGTISFIISGIIIIAFAFVMPAKTWGGALAREHILGFKNYLTVAEKDRIKFHNAPEKNPRQFEKLLPFAMVLGVEKEWAGQFAGIYDQKPSWYHDASGGKFTALGLANSLGSFQAKANTAISAKPSSASGGGSGFSGGGAGGGFGGGGGGSW